MNELARDPDRAFFRDRTFLQRACHDVEHEGLLVSVEEAIVRLTTARGSTAGGEEHRKG